MSRDPTDDLIAALVRDARPVRPVRSLGHEVARIAALAALATLGLVALLGLRPAGLGLPPGTPPFTLMALGLGAAGLGAVTAALAYTRPGHEPAGRAAAAAALGALLICAAASAVLLHRAAPADTALFGGAREIPCLIFSLVLALPPAILVARLAADAAPLQPLRTSLLAAVGATALGTLAAHLTCRTPGAWHGVMVHGLAPLIGGIVFAAPIAAALRRWRRAV